MAWWIKDYFVLSNLLYGSKSSDNKPIYRLMAPKHRIHIYLKVNIKRIFQKLS